MNPLDGCAQMFIYRSTGKHDIFKPFEGGIINDNYCIKSDHPFNMGSATISSKQINRAISQFL